MSSSTERKELVKALSLSQGKSCFVLFLPHNLISYLLFFFKLNLIGQHFICLSVGGKDPPRVATDVDFQRGA